jgi:DNA-binding transcriptional ArsR family regulator
MKTNKYTEKSEYQELTLKLAPMLDALSHPARLQILLHLAKFKSCPAHNISRRLPLCKSTVSQHMSKLKEAGLITCTPDGVCQNYQLNDKNFALVKKYFLDFYEQIDDWKEKRGECKPVDKDLPVCCSHQ